MANAPAVLNTFLAAEGTITDYTSLDPREVVREIAANKGFVEDRTWQAAVDAGWQEPQLLEAFVDTVRTILTNYFNHFVDTEQDVPRAPAL